MSPLLSGHHCLEALPFINLELDSGFRRSDEYGKARVLPSFFAVGTPVARRPPHRSVREAFPHTAPASGRTLPRTRSSALCALTRPCVRSAFCSREFPLASPLPSTPSAAVSPALFGGFVGTMGL